MKNKFKIIIIILVLLFLSLYSWNLILYNKYGEIGRYQINVLNEVLDTKTGEIFKNEEFVNWYSYNPISLTRAMEKQRALKELAEKQRTLKELAEKIDISDLPNKK